MASINLLLEKSAIAYRERHGVAGGELAWGEAQLDAHQK